MYGWNGHSTITASVCIILVDILTDSKGALILPMARLHQGHYVSYIVLAGINCGRMDYWLHPRNLIGYYNRVQEMTPRFFALGLTRAESHRSQTRAKMYSLRLISNIKTSLHSNSYDDSPVVQLHLKNVSSIPLRNDVNVAGGAVTGKPKSLQALQI
jgi:hypothetical protein